MGIERPMVKLRQCPFRRNGVAARFRLKAATIGNQKGSNLLADAAAEAGVSDGRV
jgi:hypothetical protein